MSKTYLDGIISAHRERAASDARVWQERIESLQYNGPSMATTLRNNVTSVSVIAEFKRRSPSKGDLNAHMDAASIGQMYERSGATAISVLTDEEFFGGSKQDLLTVRSSTNLPVLRKDFTVCENDVLDCAEMGASTVLLIAAALSQGEMQSLFAVAKACNVDALFEVHDEIEAAMVLDLGAELVGINQRDLFTFAVDANHAERVVAALPSSVIKVCESGLRNVADVERARDAGFDAVLVGESFVTAESPEMTVREFASVLK